MEGRDLKEISVVELVDMLDSVLFKNKGKVIV